MAALPAANESQAGRAEESQSPSEGQTGADSPKRLMTTERPAMSSVAEPSDPYWKLRICADPSVFSGCEDEWSPAPLDAAGWGESLEIESEELLAGFSVAEPRAPYGKRRVYVDTSVIGGCEEKEFWEHSRRLFEDFRSGHATLVVSDLTLKELGGAPDAVKAWFQGVPSEHTEILDTSSKAEQLADAYVAAGALGPRQYDDALHVALASLAGVDVLASWNFNHMVNAQRIPVYHAVNRRMGYAGPDIKSPKAMTDDD